MNEKEHFIKACFGNWREYLDKIYRLKSEKGNYYLDVIFIALCCFIDELSHFLVQQRQGAKKPFLDLLQNVSKDDCFSLVDLLFFYQWKSNGYLKTSSGGYYKKLKDNDALSEEIKSILIGIYGGDTSVNSNNTRYKKITDITEDLKNSGFTDKNKIEEFQNYLKLFTVTDVLYHFGRCTAVHEGYTMLLSNTSNGYQENYFITIDLLKDTLGNILNRWEQTCLRNNKMPFECNL